jgi:hypothetical protein
MSQTDNLPQNLKDAPPIILSVLKAFQITQCFIAGLDYYIPNDAPWKAASGAVGTLLTTEWVAFLDVSC